MVGWMTFDFTSFSTVIQSYQDDGRMINTYSYFQELEVNLDRVIVATCSLSSYGTAQTLITLRVLADQILLCL